MLTVVGMLNSCLLIGQVSPAHLRTLSTTYDVHTLTLEEAAKSYPVRLTGVVTYYKPFGTAGDALLFIHDSSGSVFVSVLPPAPAQVRPGTLIEVTGLSAPGNFAPIVAKGRIHIFGDSHVPVDAPRVSLTQLLTGKFDGQWVEAEGVVRSIRTVDANVDLRITLADGSISAMTPSTNIQAYTQLLDATIRIRANAAPMFNKSQQMTGAQLFFPGLQEITIEEPPVADPFSLPTTPVERLLRYTPNLVFQHRVHVRGNLTLYWPGRSLCIDASPHGLCVQTTQTSRLTTGDLVDLVGFPAQAGLTPTLTDSTFRSAGSSGLVTARSVNAERALQGDEDAKLVQIEGKLLGKDRSAKDPTMILSSGKFIFPVVLPNESTGSTMPAWEEGSTLRVTGICFVKMEADRVSPEGYAIPASFQILLRSPEDVIVIQKPSVWTAAHLFPILAALLGIAMFVLCWIWVLRHRIADQSQIIRNQNNALKTLSFQDGLTGIANRRKFDETLQLEYGTAAQSTGPVSLLMVDIDHFKALNDSYGHQRGDECLVQVAQALVSASMRKTDMVARYGGEEFAVILPGCDEIEAIAIAERMRTAVADLEIANIGSPTFGYVSISVGVATTLPAFDNDPRSLIATADGALYQSKLHGRNRTTSSSLCIA